MNERLEKLLIDYSTVDYETLKRNLHRANVRELYKYHLETCDDCDGTLCPVGKRLSRMLQAL